MSESFQFIGGKEALFYLIFSKSKMAFFLLRFIVKKIITQLEDFVYAKSDGSLLPFSRMDPVSAKRKKEKEKK